MLRSKSVSIPEWAQFFFVFLLMFSLVSSTAFSVVTASDSSEPSSRFDNVNNGCEEDEDEDEEVDLDEDEEDEEDEEDIDKSTKTKKRKMSPEEEFVLGNIKDFLKPTTFVEHPDGRVTMTFNFRKKLDEHKKIFTPYLKPGVKSKFRYTVYQEEVVIGGDEGLRLSDKGLALLNCWWKDSVEAEANFYQYVNHTNRLSAGLIFFTDKKKGLGSNFGGQAVEYSGGRPKKKTGKTIAISFNQMARIGLKIRGGVYEAQRKGKSKAKAKYKQKYFGSGRIGFLWGGSNALIVPTLKITGKIDYPTMAKKMKKYMRISG